LNGATAVHVSPNGNFIWIGCTNQPTATQLYYSDDYGLSFSVRNQEPYTNYVSTNWTSIAVSNDGANVAGGGQAYFNACRQQPNQMANLVAGTGIAFTSTEGTYTISSTLSQPTTLVYEGVPSVVAVSGFFANGYTITHNWDFINYEYEFNIDIQTFTGTAPNNAFFNWWYDNNTTLALYRQNWMDHNGASFFGTGEKLTNNIIFLYQDSNIHHCIKGRLRYSYNPMSSYHDRLVFETSVVQTPQLQNTATYNGNFRTSRGYEQRLATSNASRNSFSGNRPITFYVDFNQYFGTMSNSIYFRVFRIPIR
jgi:hypothetical protein